MFEQWTVPILGFGCILFSHFDIMWMVRLYWSRIQSRFRRKLELTEESIMQSICYTTDIDYFVHMNNAKYFREFDFGRFDYYHRTRFLTPEMSSKGVYIVQHGASIRYRRSIDFLVLFKVHTKMIYFDEKALYFEQKCITNSDNFVRAIAICKNAIVGLNVIDYMEKQHGLKQPKCPEEVQKWIESNDISSRKLRLAGEGVSVPSNLSDYKKKE